MKQLPQRRKVKGVQGKYIVNIDIILMQYIKNKSNTKPMIKNCKNLSKTKFDPAPA